MIPTQQNKTDSSPYSTDLLLSKLTKCVCQGANNQYVL